MTLRWCYYSTTAIWDKLLLVILKALIESFQNQVSFLDLEQVVKNAVDLQSFTGRRRYMYRPAAFNP